MDHIQKFEHNVMIRVRDINNAKNVNSTQLDIRPSYLFLGVTIGLIISRITALTKK